MKKELSLIDLFELAVPSNKTIMSPLSVRTEAINSYMQNSLPTLKTEEWKYTNIRTILQHEYTLGSENEVKLFGFKPEYLGIEAEIFVFVNGQFSAKHSKFDSGSMNFNALTMSEALEEQAELIEQYYCKSGALNESVFCALNTASVVDGIFLQIKKSRTIAKPFLFIYITDDSEGSVFNQTRNLIVADENCEATFFEAHFSANDLQTLETAAFSNYVTELFVNKDARVTYNLLQNENSKAFQFNHLHIQQDRNSSFWSNAFTLGGSIVRNELKIEHKGENCNTKLNGLYLPVNEQHHDNFTFVNHASANCTSNQVYKGIAKDKASAVFFGKVFVARNAQKTDASQNNKNIISDESKITSRPQLEIYADDVKCSHGSSTGKIDQEAIFYMQARCISKETAKHLLLQAFANEVVDKIANENIKQIISEFVVAKLG